MKKVVKKLFYVVKYVYLYIIKLINNQNHITMNTYDIIFNNNESSDCKGFKASLEYCMNYISMHNGTDESYFADYKGGTVEVVCNQTGKTYFSDLVK